MCTIHYSALKNDFCNYRMFKRTTQHDNSALEVKLVAFFKPLHQSCESFKRNCCVICYTMQKWWIFEIYYLSTLANNTLVLQDMHLLLISLEWHMNHNKQLQGSPHIISYTFTNTAEAFLIHLKCQSRKIKNL